MKKKVLLICSDGGHLAQVLELKELFLHYDYLIVTETTDATISLKEKYNVKYLQPRPKGKRTFRFWWSIFVNLFLSIKILFFHYPKVIITTGSHTAVPMCILGKVFFVKIVWILSFARIDTKAKSASLIYPIADEFIVQWPTAKVLYPKAKYLGGIY